MLLLRIHILFISGDSVPTASFLDSLQAEPLKLGIKAFFAQPSRPPPGRGSLKYLSPASHIIGNFQRLKVLAHPNICSYTDIIPSKHGTFCHDSILESQTKAVACLWSASMCRPLSAT